MKGDEEVLDELRQSTEGLLFMSESDYPFQTFRWEAATEINAGYLRKLTGKSSDAPVRIQSVEDFFGAATSLPEWKQEQERDTAKRYQSLVQLLKENLPDAKVYRVGEISIEVFIVGKGHAGNWLGLSTKVIET